MVSKLIISVLTVLSSLSLATAKAGERYVEHNLELERLNGVDGVPDLQKRSPGVVMLKMHKQNVQGEEAKNVIHNLDVTREGAVKGSAKYVSHPVSLERTATLVTDETNSLAKRADHVVQMGVHRHEIFPGAMKAVHQNLPLERINALENEPVVHGASPERLEDVAGDDFFRERS